MSRTLPTPVTAETGNWSIKVLYDHACPMCRSEVVWLNDRDKQGRLFFEDISASDFDASRYGINQSDVEAAIHGVLPDGRIVTGVEVFRHMYSAVGLGWLLAPTAWPVLRELADAAYRFFARHRVRMGRALGRDCHDVECRTHAPTASAPSDS
jgi:predicted DCC family thiol-disulfide oxidoreductase YuxK